MDETIRSVSIEGQTVLTNTLNLITLYGFSVLGAFVTLVLGLWVAGWASHFVRRAFGRFRYVDPMLVSFAASVVKYVIIALTVIAVLNKFGIETASLLTVIGAAGLAIGLALQGTLSHIAAGIMLLIFRPFRAGDVIESGSIHGTVKEVNLFFTEMSTPENVHMIVPNGLIWGQWIRNFSVNDTRRVQVLVKIAPDADCIAAQKIIERTLEEDAISLSDPTPTVMIHEMTDDMMQFEASFWVKTANVARAKYEVAEKLQNALNAAGMAPKEKPAAPAAATAVPA
ncbi:MAG: mscS [Rhodospirillales bacterium]|nr:mscS [Rhodospirillales bacterium]